MGGALTWLTTGSNWSGSGGVWARLLEHLRYTGIAMAIALVIALPLGALIGHTGKGVAAVSGVANAFRALPTLGVLIVLTLWAFDNLKGSLTFLAPSIAVLVVLAIPPMLSNTYAGIAAVDPAARDAAKGMGMTGGKVLTAVEIPVALPLILSGIRSAYLQVVATATIAAVIGLGGLGRFVLDGQKQQDYAEMVAGAILVALVAIIGDRIIALIGRLVVSPGISGRRVREKAATLETVPPT
ncbi:ABC transporter permease [Nakamurella flavida]|uniref:ABC transporter permease n=1 Tax=Nakamurella flavida TaxID=363630 RepID=A0A938YPT9_9ACTN|nr:ABC transporter permease [Nakamurella flavida]MBM9477008.1 ABC transporter permease [Nakamurella flavida]MDP9779953.1 osmoprotectant transport system permease protein [Nakamurella flavida]